MNVDTMDLMEDEAIEATDNEDDDDSPSSTGSNYEETPNLMDVAMENEVTAQLVAAGVVGVAAAAAITSSKKKKRPHSFETNPSIRKRQQNRLLRKLRQTIYEYATRVGQQAVVLVATPGKPNNIYKVFGAKPLEDVMKNLRNIVMDELETALAQQAPPRVQEDPSLFELPPLIIDGIPTPVEKMTQAQLRAFIPLMLKYSTGRGKPGWGRDNTRPPWWPKELPWANVRMDARTEEEKQKISWTHALRKIVLNCYKYHGREDLLPAFSEEDEKANAIAIANSNVSIYNINKNNSLQTNSVINQSHHNETNVGVISSNIQKIHTTNTQDTIGNTQVCIDSLGLSEVDYTQTVLQTIQNADGTVSIIQVDPNNPIITLSDGTTAQVQGVATIHSQNDNIHNVQTIGDGSTTENVTVDLSEATLTENGQLIITGEDGYPMISNMITLPVSAQVYQTVVANIQHIQSNPDGTLCIPMQVDKTVLNESSNAKKQIELKSINIDSSQILAKTHYAAKADSEMFSLGCKKKRKV